MVLDVTHKSPHEAEEESGVQTCSAAEKTCVGVDLQAPAKTLDHLPTRAAACCDDPISPIHSQEV